MVLSVARERSDLSIFFDCLMVSNTLTDQLLFLLMLWLLLLIIDDTDKTGGAFQLLSNADRISSLLLLSWIFILFFGREDLAST